MEVVSFAKAKAERELIWACNCGCTVHYAFANGRIECSACETVAAEFGGEWRERLPSEPAEAKPLDADNFKTVFNLSGSEAFMRKHAKDESVRFIAIGFDDGSLSTWSNDVGGTEDREAWLDRMLAKARKLISPIAANPNAGDR